MRVIIGMLLFFSAGVLPAEQRYCTYGRYKRGQLVHLFGDRVNVRNSPSTSGRIVARLRAGTPLSVLKVTKVMLTIKKYREPWYWVRFTYRGRRINGYIWGGLIAKGIFRPGRGLMAVVGMRANSDGTKKGLVRLLSRNGRVLQEMDFVPAMMNEGPGLSYSITAKPFAVRGFPGYLKFFRIVFEYGACDYTNGDVVFAVRGRRLIRGFTAMWAVNEIMGISIRYISGKRRNTLSVVFTTSKHGRNNKPAKIEEIRYEDYRWNGRLLKLVKKGKLPLK